MTIKLRLRRRLAASIVAAAVLAPLAGLVAAPVTLAADDDGLDMRTAARYVLIPDSRLVRVTIDVRITNRTPNTTRNGVVTRYFFDRVLLATQDEATRVRAQDDGRRLTVRKVEQKGFDQLTIRLARSLFFGQTQTFRLTYDLPGGKPRSASDIRVGRAFATFYTWALGDRATVRVEVPAGFEVDTYGEDVRTSSSSGRTILSATVVDTDGWYVGVYADNEANLREERLDLAGGETVVVRSWPEDATWARQVGALLTKALPELEELLGLPWPVLGDLEVSEVHTPLLEGYAGIYDSSTDEIVITEDLDDLVIVHEAAHAWLNNGLFDERWANEGLADLYAALTLVEVGQPRERAPDVDRDDPAAFALLDWGPPEAIDDEATDDREDYGYGASWHLMELIHREIGEDGLRAVMRAADAETIPYVGEPEPERLRGDVDWRRFLDLLEEVGGSRSAPDLFDTWVIPASERPALAARTAARRSYADLLEAGAGWLPPIAVRQPMADWRWAVARDRMADATEVLAARDELASAAQAAGLAPPDGLETAYESASSSFGEATRLVRSQLDALGVVVATAESVAAPRDALMQWGLDGVVQPETRLQAARTAWSAGDLDRATAEAAAAKATLAAAPEAGRAKAFTFGGVATAAALLLLVLAVFIVMRRRRRGRVTASVVAGAAGPSFGGPAGSFAARGGDPDEATQPRPTPTPGERPPLSSTVPDDRPG